MLAAREIFAKRGFHAASVQEIALAAGVSAGLLYRYFDGKAELAAAVVARDAAAAVVAVERLGEAARDPRQALDLLVQGWIEAAIADRAGCALVAEIGAEATRDGQIAAAAAAYDAALVGAIAELAGGSTRAEARALATLLATVLEGLASRLAIDEGFDPRPASRVLRRALALLLEDGARP